MMIGVIACGALLWYCLSAIDGREELSKMGAAEISALVA